MANILDTIPLADEKHPLEIFSGAPAGHIVPDLNDWEDILNPMMHQAFGYGATTNTEILKSLPQQGTHSLNGFYQFINYFVVHWGLQGSLFEGKIELTLI